jgi:predicted TIM-barrel fold metal-dependent hydrolase
MTAVIDAHVHVWSGDRERYPRLAGGPEYTPAQFTPEDFLARALPAGVGRAVLVQPAIYGFDNSYLLDCLGARPGVFSGIGVVDPGGPDPAGAMRRLGARGVRGFRVLPAGMAIDAMWRCGAEYRLAICLLIDPRALPDVGRMCARFPNTPVVIDHLARIGADGTIRDADVHTLCDLARYRNVAVKVSAFYALGRKQAPYTGLVPLIRRVFEHFGARRLMWGSDAPFQLQDGHGYTASLGLVRGLEFLTDEERGWILAGTAEALFF